MSVYSITYRGKMFIHKNIKHFSIKFLTKITSIDKRMAQTNTLSNLQVQHVVFTLISTNSNIKKIKSKSKSGHKLKKTPLWLFRINCGWIYIFFMYLYKKKENFAKKTHILHTKYHPIGVLKHRVVVAKWNENNEQKQKRELKQWKIVSVLLPLTPLHQKKAPKCSI